MTKQIVLTAVLAALLALATATEARLKALAGILAEANRISGR